MNKDEYNHFHSYQDQKDAFNQKIDDKADLIYKESWDDSNAILNAIAKALSESEDYAAIVQYCRRTQRETILGAVTLELIDVHLARVADEQAEDELT